MGEHVVARSDELEEASRLLVEVEGTDIAIFRVDGELYAYANWCAHQGGPVGEGALSGKYTGSFDKETLETEYEWIRDGEFLYCPWHAWEYDITTGDCLSNPRFSLPSFDVTEEDGKIILTV